MFQTYSLFQAVHFTLGRPKIKVISWTLNFTWYTNTETPMKLEEISSRVACFSFKISLLSGVCVCVCVCVCKFYLKTVTAEKYPQILFLSYISLMHHPGAFGYLSKCTPEALVWVQHEILAKRICLFITALEITTPDLAFLNSKYDRICTAVCGLSIIESAYLSVV